MSEQENSIKRPESIKNIPERLINSLEDKQLDFCYSGYQTVLKRFKKKRFWVLIFSLAGCWLILPPIFYFKFYRQRIAEWNELNDIKQEIKTIRKQRQRRKIWQRIWSSKNLIESEYTEELRNFYKNLIDTARQYNIRVGLFDFALDRQEKKLDPLFNVEDFTQIEETFSRIYAELSSALNLLKLAENNPEMDLVTLLKDEWISASESAEYVNQSEELGTAGQFVQDLLLLETSLKRDISDFAGDFP